MKTKKITLITALIAFGAILFGQASYAEKSSRFENLANNYLSMTEITERDGYKKPLVYRSYPLKQSDFVYEEKTNTEAWMTSPFESKIAENDLNIETWMVSPFVNKYADADLKVESWMASSFESKYADVDLNVESWMTSPFKTDDHIEIESWMTGAF